jgi:IS5 family transposase
MPIDGSPMTRWRKRLGPQKVEKILGLSIDSAIKIGVVELKDLERVIVDTTVMEKNIAYPTDTQLIEKSRKKLVKMAAQKGLNLRQNYNLVAVDLERKTSGYFRAKQFKRAKKSLNKMKTILGRVVRDCERKIIGNTELEKHFAEGLNQAKHLIERRLKDKDKLYSLHAPEVECIAKGKTLNPYEFGCKVSLVMTHKKGRGLIIGCQALHGNPFDGHMLEGALEQANRLPETTIKEAFCDRGYKWNGVQSCAVYISGQRRGVSKAVKKA